MERGHHLDTGDIVLLVEGTVGPCIVWRRVQGGLQEGLQRGVRVWGQEGKMRLNRWGRSALKIPRRRSTPMPAGHREPQKVSHRGKTGRFGIVRFYDGRNVILLN